MYRRRQKDSPRPRQAAAAKRCDGEIKRAASYNSGLSKAGKAPADVVQKMAVMAARNWKDQKDALVWNNLQYAEKMAGGPIGDLQSQKVWSQLKDEQEIRIVEHGQVGGLGTKKITGRKHIPYSAGDIAASMFDRKTGVPESVNIGKVTFQSCYAGVGGDSSLVSGMAAELARHGRKNVPVEGRTGIAFGFEGMGEETAETSTEAYAWRNPGAELLYQSRGLDASPHGQEMGLKAYFDAMYSLQNEVTQRTRIKIFKDVGKYNDPWTLVDKSEKEWDKLDPEKRGKLVAFEMAKYWENLIVLMGNMGGFKPPEKAVVELPKKK